MPGVFDQLNKQTPVRKKQDDEVGAGIFAILEHNQKQAQKQITPKSLNGLMQLNPNAINKKPATEIPKVEVPKSKLPTLHPAQQKVYEEAGEVVPNNYVDAYHPLRKFYDKYPTKEKYDQGKKEIYNSVFTARNLVESGKVKLEQLPEYIQKDILDQVNYEKRTDSERLQKDKEYQEGIKNPIGKFLERTSRVASNTFLGSDYNYIAPSQNVADVGSDIAGTLIGYATNIPGAGTSQLGIANNMLGAPTEAIVSKATGKLGNKALKTVLPMAARGATEGASLAGIQGVQQGLTPQEIGKKMLVEGGIGAIADPLLIGGGGLLGKGISKVADKVKPKAVELPKIKQNVADNINTQPMKNNSLDDILSDKEIAATALKEPPQVDIPNQKLPSNTMTQSEPALDLGKSKERGYSKSLKNDPNTNAEFKSNLDEYPLTYDPINNAETYAKAEKDMSKGFEYAYQKFDYMDFEGDLRPESVVLGELLIRQAADNGQIKLSREIAGTLAAKLTEAGQFIQAASILRRGEPEGFMVFMQRQLNKINEEGIKKLGKKWNEIDLTDDEIKLVQTMTKDNADSVQDQIFASIAQRMPSTNMEKINAWRRTAMLLNPLTHVRNIGGNTLMAGMRKTADSVAAVMENAIPQAKRTKSIGWSKDKTIKSLVDADWDNVKKSLTSNNDRWNIQSTLGREKRIFKNPMLEKLNKFSGQSLEAEDIPFMSRAYKDALGGFVKARGLKEVTQEARDYASRRALEATYKDLNAFSKVITKLKKGSGIIGEAALPFAKTPANITVRAFEYSPAGLMKSFAQAAIDARKGTFDPAKFIEQFSKGITGTAGLTTLGFYLADAGIITGAPDDDKDKAAFDKATGKLPYAIKIGGKYYSYEWAQPLAISLAMGAEIRNSVKDNDGLLETIKNGMVAGGDTLFNTSVLTNIKNLFGGYYDSPTEAVMETLGQLPKQMVPTIGGQVARTFDPTDRVTFDKDPMKNFTNYLKSRTPGMTQSLTPRVDIKGQEVTRGGNDLKGIGQRALQNFLNPAKVGTGEMTPADKEIERLYNQSGKKDIFPKVSPNNFRDNNIPYELTTEEKAQWQRTMGQYTYKKINELMLSPRYKLLQDYSDNSKIYTKAKAINGIIEDAYEKAKAEYLKNKKK